MFAFLKMACAVGVPIIHTLHDTWSWLNISTYSSLGNNNGYCNGNNGLDLRSAVLQKGKEYFGGGGETLYPIIQEENGCAGFS